MTKILTKQSDKRDITLDIKGFVGEIVALMEQLGTPDWHCERLDKGRLGSNVTVCLMHS